MGKTRLYPDRKQIESMYTKIESGVKQGCVLSSELFNPRSEKRASETGKPTGKYYRPT